MKMLAMGLLAGLALTGCATHPYYNDDAAVGGVGSQYERGGGLSSRIDVMRNTNAVNPPVWYPTPEEGQAAGRLPRP